MMYSPENIGERPDHMPTSAVSVEIKHSDTLKFEACIKNTFRIWKMDQTDTQIPDISDGRMVHYSDHDFEFKHQNTYQAVCYSNGSLNCQIKPCILLFIIQSCTFYYTLHLYNKYLNTINSVLFYTNYIPLQSCSRPLSHP